ncbi:MAG TPA: LmeA family phospholipid-binding protein [Anaerolineales bacterium]|nr:LmeA family phospholipid-binding protein [Anaerolineales bacterium]
MKFSGILIVAITAVVLSILACGGPLQVGGPTPPYEPIPVSTESVQSLKDKFNSVGAVSGEVTVAITESELTSFVDAQFEAQPDSAFSDPQVYLRDGKIKLYVTVTTSNLKGNALIVLNPTVADNKLTVTVESADFGPVPVPQDVLSSLTSTVNDQLLAMVSNLPTGVGLKSIAIADGQMTLTAIVK